MNNWFYYFLRRTQKYTGTDNVYLAKGGGWLTLEKIMGMIASFLLAVAFANLLDPVIYGSYKYILSLMGIFAIFSLNDMQTAVAQAVARNSEDSFYSGFKTKLKWGILGSLTAIGVAIYYWFKGSSLLPIPLLLIALFLPIMEASRIYTGFLMGRKLFNVQVKYSISSQIISAVAMIAILFLTKNLLWLIAAYLITHTFSNYFFYCLSKFKLRPNKNEDSQTINYGKQLSLIGVISALGSYLDKTLLFILVGPTQLAIYSFATLLPEEIRNTIGNINVLALPKLASRPLEEIKATMLKKIWKLAILIGAIIIVYILLAPYFYEIFFPQYLNAVPYSQIFILSLIFLPTTLLGTVFQAKIMKKELYLLKIATSSIRIILFLVLIPFYGIWGVIIAGVVGSLFNSALTLFLFRRA